MTDADTKAVAEIQAAEAAWQVADAALRAASLRRSAAYTKFVVGNVPRVCKMGSRTYCIGNGWITEVVE